MNVSDLMTSDVKSCAVNEDLRRAAQIMWENDYPHGDTSFPQSKQMAEKLVAAANLSEDETWKLMRGNAIACYGLDRYGITR